VAGPSRNGDTRLLLAKAEFESVREACRNNISMASTFSPERFKGDVVLFAAAHSSLKLPIEAWKSYVEGSIGVHQIECTHDAMLDEPSAAIIGKVLTNELEKQRRTSQAMIQWRTK